MTERRRNLYLTGFSGSGKTHSGRAAAKLLNLNFVDMDTIIEARCGKTIPRIFEEAGEPRFRQLEHDVLVEISAGMGQLISTGGGTPMRQDNRDIMSQTGYVIRLRASAETIHERLTSSRGSRNRTLRPILGGDAPVERIGQVLAEREQAYAAADMTLDTDGRSPSDVAAAIASAWRSVSAELDSTLDRPE